MNVQTQRKVFVNEEARQFFESSRLKWLFTRFCDERTELPSGRDAQGYFLIENHPITLAEFTFNEDYHRRGTWCTLELRPAVQWSKPAFTVSEYFLGGDYIDRVIVTSQNARMVELAVIDRDTFFDNTVRIRKSRTRPYDRVIGFAKSNRKPVVLSKFLLEYHLDLDSCLKSVDGLLRNNIVEVTLAYLRNKNRSK